MALPHRTTAEEQRHAGDRQVYRPANNAQNGIVPKLLRPSQGTRHRTAYAAHTIPVLFSLSSSLMLPGSPTDPEGTVGTRRRAPEKDGTAMHRAVTRPIVWFVVVLLAGLVSCSPPESVETVPTPPVAPTGEGASARGGSPASRNLSSWLPRSRSIRMPCWRKSLWLPPIPSRWWRRRAGSERIHRSPGPSSKPRCSSSPGTPA